MLKHLHCQELFVSTCATVKKIKFIRKFNEFSFLKRVCFNSVRNPNEIFSNIVCTSINFDAIFLEVDIVLK